MNIGEEQKENCQCELAIVSLNSTGCAQHNAVFCLRGHLNKFGKYTLSAPTLKACTYKVYRWPHLIVYLVIRLVLNESSNKQIRIPSLVNL